VASTQGNFLVDDNKTSGSNFVRIVLLFMNIQISLLNIISHGIFNCALNIITDNIFIVNLKNAIAFLSELAVRGKEGVQNMKNFTTSKISGGVKLVEKTSLLYDALQNFVDGVVNQIYNNKIVKAVMLLIHIQLTLLSAIFRGIYALSSDLLGIFTGSRIGQFFNSISRRVHQNVSDIVLVVNDRLNGIHDFKISHVQYTRGDISRICCKIRDFLLFHNLDSIMNFQRPLAAVLFSNEKEDTNCNSTNEGVNTRINVAFEDDIIIINESDVSDEVDEAIEGDVTEEDLFNDEEMEGFVETENVETQEVSSKKNEQLKFSFIGPIGFLMIILCLTFVLVNDTDVFYILMK